MISKRRTSLLQKSFIDSHVDRLPPHKAIMLDEGASILQALEVMKAEKIGCVLIKSPQSSLTGIITERDIMSRAWQLGDALASTPISKIMTTSPQSLQYHASIARALYLMSEGGFRHIPIILKDGALSVVSVTDFIRFITGRIAAHMERKEDALDVINPDGGIERFFDGELSLLVPSRPVLVEPTSQLQDVVRLMAKKNIGSVVIGNQEKKNIMGIFTERDLVTKAMSNREGSASLPISEFMTPSPVTLQNTASIFYAFQAMSDGKFRHLPIVDFDERLTGILSIKNMVDFISKEIVSELNKISGSNQNPR